MEDRYVISIALNAHFPFVREYYSANDLSPSAQEGRLFDAISETYLPLLEMFNRLEGDRIPFRLSICFSPLLCQMLSDELLIKKYLVYTDRQIEFGRQELERTAGQPEERLAKRYFDRALSQRTAFTEKYECDLLKAFVQYQRRGRIELPGTSATYAFLPFYCGSQEAMRAQLETAAAFYRRCFGSRPEGFWLPELGWSPGVESCLRSCDYTYTFTEAHGFVFGNPAPSRGSFYPVLTPQGIAVLSRDYPAAAELERIAAGSPYRDNSRDAGYEYAVEDAAPLLSRDGARCATGFKYWAQDGLLYDHEEASSAAESHARAFLEMQGGRLAEAAQYMKEPPLSLCAWNADAFGRRWYEGARFLESLFRQGAQYRSLRFMTPSEYLADQDFCALERSVPAFSSWDADGYAGPWLDASSDWIYRHLARAADRMTELAERFPDETGLKERALNQAARELLLAQCSDWPRMLYRQESTEYARSRLEGSLRNFTTIYEALGSSYISTEWLTRLEKQHNIFPMINYRVWRRRK